MADEPKKVVVEQAVGDDIEASDVVEVTMDSSKKRSSSLFLNVRQEIRTLFHKMDQSIHVTDPRHRLRTDKRALEWSVYAVRFATVADAVSTNILTPNYPFMALPGSTPDSFPNTDPFGFSSATYFLPMSSLLGSTLAGVFIGSLSDRIGRKPPIMACLGVGTIGNIVKYLARDSFWGFCGASFANGLFAASLPVAMAYVSDVRHTRAEKDTEIGTLVGMYMIGMSGGGIIAILMESEGLFTPLFVGAGLSALATFFLWFFMLESIRPGEQKDNSQKTPEEIEEEESAPKELNKTLLGTIVAGAFLDNAGSAGILPIAFSPLAFNAFFADFVERGEEPIMSEVAYKWISVMVALTVIPSAASSQLIFSKIGAPAGCVGGNIITAIVIIALLYIAMIEPASNTTYGGFIAILYIGFPFTVISQLSTGPMLDMIAPVEKRGLAQGLNTSVMEFGSAVSPWALGILADEAGTEICMWVCVGISLAAALVNAPLIFAPQLARKEPPQPQYLRALHGEDEEIIEKAMHGEWVPPDLLEDLNDKRMANGQKFLVIPYRPYEEDKEYLPLIERQSREDFRYHKARIATYLNQMAEGSDAREVMLRQIKAARCPPEEMAILKEGLGKWFADYLEDHGYFMDESPILYKQMIMEAFPTINEGNEEITTDNIEDIIIKYAGVMNKYLEEYEQPLAIRAFAGRVIPPSRTRGTSV